MTINLTIQDTIAPTANCKDIVGQLNNNGIFTLTAEDINNGSTDNCTIDTMFIDKDQFTCDDLGENQVTLTVVDFSGNVSTCTANVLVEAGSFDCGNSQFNTEPDVLTLVYCRGDQISGQLNLYDNDSGFTPDAVTMTVSDLPENVEVNTTDGTMTYTNDNPSETTLTFTYTVCHNTNTENCSTAEVTIHILVDTDCDGISDDLDIDDDNDGILDIDEGDGILDTDGDGIPNSLDIDSDNDGIPDNIEWQAENNYIAPSGVDANANGWDDAYDVDEGGTYYEATQTDGDNIPDYLDTDSDADGIDDIIEGNDLNYDHIADFLPIGQDSDGDGLDDAYDTLDLTASSTNKYLNAARSNVPLQDWDGINGRDWRDPNPTNPDPNRTQDVFVPNGFSPNGDNINDYFKITLVLRNEDGSYAGEGDFGEAHPNAKIEIYNRWGNMVYKLNNYGNTTVHGTTDAWWDGRPNVGVGINIGKEKLPPGTYYYILDYGNGNKEAGYVFLNR